MGAVDLYIQSIDGPQQEIVIELRRIISRISADFKEEMKWNVPTFSIKRNICSIIPHKNHVNLQFFKVQRSKTRILCWGVGKECVTCDTRSYLTSIMM